MPKVHDFNGADGIRHLVAFDCKPCGYMHAFRVRRVEQEPETVPIWTFNEDYEKPTFSPSLRVHGTAAHGKSKGHPMCHSIITDGMIQYCGDCEHELAGQTVEMEEFDND